MSIRPQVVFTSLVWCLMSPAGRLPVDMETRCWEEWPAGPCEHPGWLVPRHGVLGRQAGHPVGERQGDDLKLETRQSGEAGKGWGQPRANSSVPGSVAEWGRVLSPVSVQNSCAASSRTSTLTLSGTSLESCLLFIFFPSCPEMHPIHASTCQLPPTLSFSPHISQQLELN